MIKTKRGIEPVIATVLLIVITIAVIGVLVAFLYPYIRGMTEKETACRDIKLEIDSSGTYTTNSLTYVMVGYTSGSANQTRVVVQATGQGSTVSNATVSNKLNISEAMTYTVNMPNAIKVGAVPYVVYNGKEYMCDNGKAELTSVPKK
jgi:flagellin-like protein